MKASPRWTMFALVALPSCAPILFGTLPERCQTEYDLCLNRCPRVAQGSGWNWQPEVASCTELCNANAPKCAR